MNAYNRDTRKLLHAELGLDNLTRYVERIASNYKKGYDQAAAEDVQCLIVLRAENKSLTDQLEKRRLEILNNYTTAMANYKLYRRYFDRCKELELDIARLKEPPCK